LFEAFETFMHLTPASPALVRQFLLLHQ